MYYKRDISSVLTTLMIVLIAIVGYQLWMKPAPQVPPSSLSANHGAEDVSPSPAPSVVDRPEHTPADVPSSRLVELGEAPDPVLGEIRLEFEKANYGETEHRLKGLTMKTISEAPARRYVAGLWNNLGIQQEKLGGTARSVRAFKQAVTWDPTSPLAHLNLTQAYWELRDPAMTPKFLETVIHLAPDDPFPHLALADVLISKGKRAMAAPHLEQTRHRVSRDSNLKAYWDKLKKKVDERDLAETPAEHTTAPDLTSGQTHSSAVLTADSPTASASAMASHTDETNHDSTSPSPAH